jgi:hypothetical protein
MNNSNQHKSIVNFFDSFVRELKQDAPKNTGELEKSISYDINDDKIEVEMLAYGNLLEEGINGTERNVGSIYSFTDKKPPISAISDYAKSIGANPYALQNSIFKKGIRPKRFIKPNLDENINNFVDQYAEAVWEDIKETLE